MSECRVRLWAAGCSLAVVTALPGNPTHAQDAHYWTYQYGARANLLGGQVVGSVVDISAVYYSPGALSLIDDPELIATSRVFEASAVSLEGAEDRSTDDLRLDVAPGFFAGILPFRFLRDHVLAYSIFTRYRFETKLNETSLGQVELPEYGTGPVDYLGEARLERDLNEQWFGLSWSMPIGRKLGFGVSQFLAYRGQKGIDRLSAQAYSAVDGAAVTVFERKYSYYNYRLLWKVGATFDWMGVSVGLTATTPSVSVFGEGKSLLNQTTFGQDVDGDDVEDPVFIAGYEEGLSALYKSSPSLGLGATYAPGKNRIHFSAEYFTNLSEYDVMDLQDFEGQSTGDTVAFDLTHRLEAVLNAGLAFEHNFTPTFTGYGSFRTDFSARPAGSGFDISTTSWDIYHLTAGAAFRIGSADLTVGLGFGWGEKAGVALVEDVGDADQLLSPLFNGGEVKYRSARLLFAFSY